MPPNTNISNRAAFRTSRVPPARQHVTYSALVGELLAIPGAKVVTVLEGGYNIPAIQHGLHAVVAEQLGLGEVHGSEGDSSNVFGEAFAGAERDIEATISVQKQYWPCLA